MKYCLLGFLIVIFSNQALSQNPEVRRLYQLGFRLFEDGKKAESLEYFSKIHSIDSTEITALEYMAMLYADLKLYEKAANSSAKLSKLSPKNASFYSNACYYFILSNQPALAVAYGKKAVQLDEVTYSNMLNLGHCYLLRNRNEEAQYWYIKALQWTSNNEQFQKAFIGDLDQLYQLGLISKNVAENYKNGLAKEAAQIFQNIEGSVLLDSILTHRGSSTSILMKERILQWKKEFIELEIKSSVVRYTVLARFLHDIGLYEFEKRNRAIALDVYFTAAEKMYVNEADSLGQAQFLLAVSNELLTRIQNENRLSKNSAALEYAEDAGRIIEKYKLLELETAALIQLSDCYYQNKMDQEGTIVLWHCMKRSGRLKDGHGTAQAAYRLSAFYKKQLLLDSAFYYSKIGLSNISSADFSTDLAFKIHYNQTELLYKNNQIKASLEYGLKLKSALDREKNNDEQQSSLCELLGLILFENNGEDFAVQYLDSAIDYYLGFMDKQASQGLELTNAPLSIAKNLSLRLLAYINARKGNADGTFFYAECMKDNFLKKELSNHLKNPPFVINLNEAKSQLSQDAAAISYTGTKSNIGIVVGFNTEVSKVALLDEQNDLSVLRNIQLNNTFAKISEILKVIGRTPKDSISYVRMLTLMQYNYLRNDNSGSARSVIKKKAIPNNSKELELERKALARLLYDLYVKPVESIIKGKKKLIICPDFTLQVFPFETLMMPDGRYMAEAYDISYTSGFTISQFLDKRSYNSTKNIMAFGNPNYTDYNPQQLSGRALDLALLGIDSWSELPGTEKELLTFQSKTNSSKIFSGTSVTETGLKNLSSNGTLKKASILHFALHGIAGTAMSKEDNSLVLTEPNGSSEDGLLQFYEAMSLEIEAEIVCLSACETGINMVEDDGSMPTMGTAFLAAGAKAVLATNWTIDDEATAIFIKDVYTQVLENGRTFLEALSNTKRSFINGVYGEKYKDPYFWAPFKYYGAE